MKKPLKILLSLGLFASLVALLIWQTPASSSIEASDLTIGQAFDLMQENKENPDFVILDLRTPYELEQGMIENAENLDFLAPNFQEKLANLDKNKNYLIFCASGHRSRKAMTIMRQAGFKNLHHMFDGMNKWYQQNYPLAKRAS